MSVRRPALLLERANVRILGSNQSSTVSDRDLINVNGQLEIAPRRPLHVLDVRLVCEC